MHAFVHAADGSFDIKWYTNAKWYVQEQMIISYLPADYLRCVTAEYLLLKKPTLLGYIFKCPCMKICFRFRGTLVHFGASFCPWIYFLDLFNRSAHSAGPN